MKRFSRLIAMAFLTSGLLATSACGAKVEKETAHVSASTSTANGDVAHNSTTRPNDSGKSSPTTEAPTSSRVSDDADTTAYVDAMVKSMMDDKDSPATETQARCFARKALAVIGVKRLQQQNVSPADLGSGTSLDFSKFGLSMDDGNRIYDGFASCGMDLRELMLDSMKKDNAGEALSAESKSCLENVFTEANTRKLMVTSLVKGDDALQNDPELKPITATLIGCMFMSMGSSETTIP